MSGGFTPFDKNSYRESKRRRKQALIEERTGRILPCLLYTSPSPRDA